MAANVRFSTPHYLLRSFWVWLPSTLQMGGGVDSSLSGLGRRKLFSIATIIVLKLVPGTPLCVRIRRRIVAQNALRNRETAYPAPLCDPSRWRRQIAGYEVQTEFFWASIFSGGAPGTIAATLSI